jgi:predicted acylesterase/phospholipase RssA
MDEGLMGAFFEWKFLVRGLFVSLNRPGCTGLMSGDKTADFIREQIGDRRIEQCQDPQLALSVTNLTRARSEVVTEGPLAEFIVASCAFPIICAARKIGGQSYWDGGIANAVPIDPWIDDPMIHTILIHEVTSEREHAALTSEREPSVSAACGLSHRIICDELLRVKIIRAEAAGKQVIIHTTVTPAPAMFRRARKRACAERGRTTALERVAIAS